MAHSGRLVGLFALALAAGCSSSNMTSNNSSTSGNKPPPPAGTSTAAVTVQDYAFSPSSQTVKTGTTVVWTNTGAVAHTVTSNASLFDSGQLASPSTGTDPYGGMSAGGSYQRVFSTPGTFAYHCSNHPYMTGTIVVTP